MGVVPHNGSRFAYFDRSGFEAWALNPQDCYFGPDSYHYWDEKYKTVDELMAAFQGQFDFYCACDPSMGKDKTKGDYTAIVIIARERKGGRLYHVLSDISRIEPHDAIELILGYYRRFHFVRFGLEVNSAQTIMAREFKRRCQEKHLYVSIKEFTNLGNKVVRIQAMQPLMKSGILMLNKMNSLFNSELRYFPKGKFDDALDSLEMAIRLAEDRKVTAEILYWGGDDTGDWCRNFRGRGLRF